MVAESQKPVNKKKEKLDKKEEDLSEEDLQLKRNLELMVERVKDPEAGVVKLALETLRTEIKTSTSSMTAVPKPLKFLRSHFQTLVDAHTQMKEGENRKTLADIVSVLAMTSGKEEDRLCLKYRLLGHGSDVAEWGHEYVRHLSMEIGAEWTVREDAASAADTEPSTADLDALVQQIVPYHCSHNAEPEAVDLLLEIGAISNGLLESHVDQRNAGRTCLYLCSCASYLPDTEATAVLQVAFNIYLKVKLYCDALRTALRMDNEELIHRAFNECTDPLEKRQLCYLLARHSRPLNLEEGACAVPDDDTRSTLQEIMNNTRLSEHYLALARDLDVMEAKAPEDVYKMHLVNTPSSSAQVDSAKANLASTLVNAFLNAGFGQDKLMTASSSAPAAEGAPAAGSSSSEVHWIFKNKEHGKMTATASLGMITLWDVEGGLPQLDKYLYSSDTNVVAGALLGVGVTCCNVRSEMDPAYALLYESVSKENAQVRIGAVLGLGLAYAGTASANVQELLLPLVQDPECPLEVASFAALALGLVFVGSMHEEVTGALLQALMTRSEVELIEPLARFFSLALGLLFLGRQELCDATAEVCKTLSERTAKYSQVMLEVCAYAGTGNVLKVQELLALCGEKIEHTQEEAWKSAHQGIACIGLAMIAMAEDLGTEMLHRTLEHLLQYSEPAVRRAVPLGLALMHVGDPDLQVMDILSRLSHDADSEVAQAALLALGVLGAGTNNARLAGMLRNLSSYYFKDSSMLFLVRVAQGLVHMGKGLLAVSPYHTEGQLMSGVGLAGLLSVLVSGLNMKATIGGKYHYLLYCIAASMYPRMLLTVDEEGKILQVPVRVGTAVDVVAQAGRPKTITGFQTHSTPVLLSVGERAELATDKYLPVTPILEGVVILKKNPDYVEA